MTQPARAAPPTMTFQHHNAADDTLDERHDSAQNWRADVSAVLTDTGKLVEFTKYTAYGLPWGLPAGDLNADGQITAGTDQALAEDLDTNNTYDVRADIDLDGDVDTADVTAIANLVGTQLGRGKLSRLDVDSRKGYAGYENTGGAIGELWHVRHRVLHTGLGRWIQRDPAGYVDGANLAGYTRSNPVRYGDPRGLLKSASLCEDASLCLAGSVDGSFNGWLDGPPNGAECASRSPDLQSCLQCCTFGNQSDLSCSEACFFVHDPSIPPQPGGPPFDLCEFPDDGGVSDQETCNRFRLGCGARSGGGTLCRSGRAISCVWLPPFAPGVPPLAQQIIRDCMIANEDTHHDDVDCNSCQQGSVCRPKFKRGTNKRREECTSDLATISCFGQRLSQCNTLLPGDDLQCRINVGFMLRSFCNNAKQWCGAKPPGCP